MMTDRLSAARTWVVCIVGACSTTLVWCGLTSSAAAERPFFLGNRKQQTEAAARVPWKTLTAEANGKIRRVVTRPSIYRRMPVETIDCDRDLFVFLVRHPEVVVNIWRRMGITKCRIKRLDRFVVATNDGAGTKSQVELVYGTPELHLFYAEGEYSGPLVRRPVSGRCVIMLSSRFGGTVDKPRVTNQLDVFLQLDHAGAELVARTIHPLVGKTADTNFTRSLQFVSQIHLAARRSQDRLQRLGMQLEGVDAEIRDEFLKVAAAVVQQEKKDKPAELDKEVQPASANVRVGMSD